MAIRKAMNKHPGVKSEEGLPMHEVNSDYRCPTNQVVLTVHVGRIKTVSFSFTRADLSIRPEP